MKIEKCIIADDFTGSADSAIHYRKAGYMTVMFINDRVLAEYDNYNVKVINTETRFDSESIAYEKVFKAASDCVSAGVSDIFKKIDSTMRGNIGSEIKAILDAVGYRAAVIAPAAPRNNRTVINGICYANGNPIKNTESGTDPFNPVASSNIVEILEKTFKKETGHINLSVVRDGSTALLNMVQELIDKGKKVITADAETMEDLKTIAVVNERPDILIAGSSGMAEALCSRQDFINIKKEILGKKILIVVGSLTSTSRAQADRFSREVANLQILLDIKKVISNSESEKKRITSLVSKNPGGLPVVIRTSESGDKIDQSSQYYSPPDGKIISGFLGNLISDLVQKNAANTIFITGGDTAYEIVSCLETECVIFEKEILPGIPLLRLIRNKKPCEISIVTKAGGFGEEDAIIRIMNYIGVSDHAV